ncbi:MAG: hypothetical protein J5617_01825 [Bacilli bacterium]|nr:hypothetical protein [Bacilli bacterium]
MEKKKLMSRGLKVLLVVTAIVAVLYLVFLALFAVLARTSGDSELGGFKAIIMYYLNGMLNLCIFKYPEGSKVIVYFALSIFFYALVLCWIIFLIAGIIVMDKKERKVVWWGIVLTFINLGVYALFAVGAQKYWHIINGTDSFKGNSALLAVTLVMLLFGALFFLLAVLSYFWSIVDSFLKPGNGVRKEYFEYEYDDSRIRDIVRDELIKNQPFKVVIVGNEKPQEEVVEEPEPVVEEQPVVVEQPVVEEPVKEEVKPEPVKEVVKEQPEPVLVPTVKFWDAAREVWPQLDNPRPLPKEEKVEEPANEEEEGWNRNKRQPFLVRIITADLDTKANYNEIKNELLSYGVKSRLSRGGDTFRLGGKEYAKIYLVGKTLKVYFALSPEDYKDSTYPIEDVGHRPNYAGMPLLFKVRSKLSVRRCKELIKAACEKDGLAQKEVKDTNWVDELRKLNAEKAKAK